MYSIKEYAQTAVDVIARRMRLAFLNTHACEEALPRIVEIMGNELNWDSKEKQVCHVVVRISNRTSKATCRLSETPGGPNVCLAISAR